MSLQSQQLLMCGDLLKWRLSLHPGRFLRTQRLIRQDQGLSACDHCLLDSRRGEVKCSNSTHAQTLHHYLLWPLCLVVILCRLLTAGASSGGTGGARSGPGRRSRQRICKGQGCWPAGQQHTAGLQHHCHDTAPGAGHRATLQGLNGVGKRITDSCAAAARRLLVRSTLGASRTAL